MNCSRHRRVNLRKERTGTVHECSARGTNVGECARSRAIVIGAAQTVGVGGIKPDLSRLQ